jgi:hypothetical protein
VREDDGILTIDLPSHLALRYQCPFCPLIILRTREEIDIVAVVREHFQDHLRLGQTSNWIGPKTFTATWPPLTVDTPQSTVSVPFFLPVPAASGTFDVAKSRLPLFVESDDECHAQERPEPIVINRPVVGNRLFTLIGSPKVIRGQHSSVPIVIDD